MNGTTAILVLSCDRYSDAWRPFFELFSRYWKDCPFPVYLGTNEQGFDFPGVNVIQSGAPRNWSDDTLSILRQMKEEYVIVLLEDYFLQSKVDNAWLQRCLDFTRDRNAPFMRIASFRRDHFPMYAYDVIKENPHFGVSRKDAMYRINLQAAIWKRQAFMELIKPGESPWEFEVNGSIRSREWTGECLGITESHSTDELAGPIPYLCTAITRGTWMREAIALCRKENIRLDLSVRPVESGFALFRRKMYHAMPFWSRKYMDYVSGKIR